MKFRLRSSTALLVAMVGMSLVFGSGCTKKKKPVTGTELPAEKTETTSAIDDKSSTQASSDTGTSSSSSSLADSGSPSGDSYSSKSGRSSDPYGDTGSGSSDTYSSSSSGSSSSLDGGLDGSRHGSATVGDDPEALASAPIPGEELTPAPATPTKKKKGKKKKKAAAAPIETADADLDGGDGGGTAGGHYVVKKGDTLSKIANHNHVSLSKLLKANSMTTADAPKLKVGTKLKIPGKA